MIDLRQRIDIPLLRGRKRARQADLCPVKEDPDAVALQAQSALETEFDKYRSEYLSRVKSSASERRNVFYALSEKERNQLHPAVCFSPTKNAAKEREARAVWRDQQGGWRCPRDAEYLMLWRTCLQFADCTPFDIVGVYTLLQAKNSAEERRSTDSTSMHGWSAPFCTQLARLITHLLWPSSHPRALADNLATAIQYAVILRTNDQRPWDPARGVFDPFLQRIRDLSAKPGMMSPMSSHHRVTRKMLTSQRYSFPAGCLSSIFLELEKLIEIPSRVLDSSALYSVTTQDLKQLECALDNLAGDTTGNRYLTTEMYYRTALAACSLVPALSAEELADYHDRAMLEECRRSLRVADEMDYAPSCHDLGSIMRRIETYDALGWGAPVVSPAPWLRTTPADYSDGRVGGGSRHKGENEGPDDDTRAPHDVGHVSYHDGSRSNHSRHNLGSSGCQRPGA